MNKRVMTAITIGLCTVMIAACNKEETNEQTSSVFTSEVEDEKITDSSASISNKEDKISNNTKAEIPEGMYISELTGEPLDESLEDQRPIAVMIDNDKKSFPHYGTTQADIVYELINTTTNDRLTRLMCIYKDWGSIEQIGNIRTAQPSNIVLAAEFDAVLCHEGGPWFNDEYFDQEKFADHFTGVFTNTAVTNDDLYTEYIMAGDLDNAFANSSISSTYREIYPKDDHKLKFTDYGTIVDLQAYVTDVTDVIEIVLPFYHNESTLRYNENTEKYEYYEYGNLYQDAEGGGILAFDNVIIQNTDFHMLDNNGYLEYYFYQYDNDNGYYITKGQCIPIYWDRYRDTDIVHYYADASYTQEIQINTGKTYIALVPYDTWDEVSLK